MRDRIDAVRLYRKIDNNRHSILGWVEGPGALAADLRGLSDFYMDLLEEPEWCSDLMAICTDTSIRFAKAQLDAGADSIGIGDAMCSQVSTETYTTLIQPFQLKLVEAIQAHGGIVRLHICGQTQHLLPGIAKLGVEIFDVDHMVDLKAAREALGPRTVLAGNINPAAGVRFGNPERIRSHVKRNFAEAGPPYMVCAGCEIPAGTPHENLSALCDPVPASM